MEFHGAGSKCNCNSQTWRLLLRAIACEPKPAYALPQLVVLLTLPCCARSMRSDRWERQVRLEAGTRTFILKPSQCLPCEEPTRRCASPAHEVASWPRTCASTHVVLTTLMPRCGMCCRSYVTKCVSRSPASPQCKTSTYNRAVSLESLWKASAFNSTA